MAYAEVPVLRQNLTLKDLTNIYIVTVWRMLSFLSCSEHVKQHLNTDLLYS